MQLKDYAKHYLKKLDKEIPEYIKQIGEFRIRLELEDKEEFVDVKLVGYRYSKKPRHCEACGHFPINNIYIVEGRDGRQWRIGSVCVGSVNRPKIARWARHYRRRKELIEKYYDLINSALNANYYFKLHGGFLKPLKVWERIKAGLYRILHGKEPYEQQRKAMWMLHYNLREFIKVDD